jgi:hypothetical protein
MFQKKAEEFGNFEDSTTAEETRRRINRRV